MYCPISLEYQLLVLSVRHYGPWERLIPCRGASGSDQVTSTKCLADASEGINASIRCLLACSPDLL